MGNECNHEEWPYTFHDYEVIKEGEGGIREGCKRCGKILVTRKGGDGIIDNTIYLKEHARDFLQPTSRFYEREYGKPNWGMKKKHET